MTLSTALRLAVIMGVIPVRFGFVTWQCRSLVDGRETTTTTTTTTTTKTTTTTTLLLSASTPPTPPKFINERLINDATMATALCVIPPDSAWDTIQRARHVARDRSYFRFPPAIRLFHPFCSRSKLSDAAIDVAKVVERFHVTPFTVLLNQWVVIPHWEALEADWEAMRQLPVEQESSSSLSAPATEGELSDVAKLIEREEILGLQRRIKRLVRRIRKQGEEVIQDANDNMTPPADAEATGDAPQALLEKQKQMYEEFNGPCVICLEPDEQSREKLLNLREILRRELFAAYENYSPSSSVSDTDQLPRAVLEMEESSFRPLVPIGAFPTTSSAIEMARKLRGLWDPLSFNVTDLHIISQGSTDVIQASAEQEYGPSGLKKTSWMSQDEEQHLKEAQYGCDAMIRLVGEELELDNDLNEELANMVMKSGMAGGYDASRYRSIANDPTLNIVPNAGMDDGDDSLDAWLDDDGDWNEGTVVVLGRTHFFTGEMRVYVGMPASSAIDAKDKALGEGISGAARRRGTTHRQGDLWQVGEFGRRDSDFTPRSNREKRQN